MFVKIRWSVKKIYGLQIFVSWFNPQLATPPHIAPCPPHTSGIVESIKTEKVTEKIHGLR